MFSPSTLQIIAGILLLLGAVIAGAAGAPSYAIPVIASLFVLIEIARGKYSIKVSGGSSEKIKLIFGFVFIFLIQCLIAWGLISLGSFLAKTITGGTLPISWFIGLGMVAFFAVLPFFLPALTRKEMMKSIFSPVLEEQEALERKQIESRVLGSLIQNSEFDDWWSSEGIHVPCLDKNTKVTFTNCNVEDSKAFVLKADKQLDAFLQMTQDDLKKFTSEVKANLDLNIEATDYGEELPFMNIKNEEEVWSYIDANQIYVNKDEDNVLISIPYNCDWEDEHGFRLDFKNGVELVYAGQDY